MMNQIKHALFFVIGGIFGSSILLAIYADLLFILPVGVISFFILASIIEFLVNNWNE